MIISFIGDDHFPYFLPMNTAPIPDPWQQEAIQALLEGHDVIVHAPTGAGKTLIFEEWLEQTSFQYQAIYTVPTRALANDKLAEWRRRGWNVGIATGDLSENLSAPVLVATLETQKNKLLNGQGPKLLVIDEYQMLKDEDRGLNYELAIAMAPAGTQLLLLSGSVDNPEDIQKWLVQLGRQPKLVKTMQRPVPLKEISENKLRYKLPGNIKGRWQTLLAKALAAHLGPILIFAPRRMDAEQLATTLAHSLPNPNPLTLTDEQIECLGPTLSVLLRSRIAYHHSGLSYAARAGVIEPLTKAGQLRIVVATMGLAAGINFSLRTVTLATSSYKRGGEEYVIQPDEILQMLGRAGRRGIDKIGYVLLHKNGVSLSQAHPCKLSRSESVDWSALLTLMDAANKIGKDPFAEALRVQRRLFTKRPVPLGIEESYLHFDAPCQLTTDLERSRRVKKCSIEILNSQNQWQAQPHQTSAPLGQAIVPTSDDPENPEYKPVLQDRYTLETVNLPTHSTIYQTPQGLCHAITLAHIYSTDHTPLAEQQSAQENEDPEQIPVIDLVPVEIPQNSYLYLTPFIRRITLWKGRGITPDEWKGQLWDLINLALQTNKLGIIQATIYDGRIIAILDLSQYPIAAYQDVHGQYICNPLTRKNMHSTCKNCPYQASCKKINRPARTVYDWKQLGLISNEGYLTTRGRIASTFYGGDGLAIAAALERKDYPLNDLIFDLANLSAGFRFASGLLRWSGRLGKICCDTYKGLTCSGYLEEGYPQEYGAGASEIVRLCQENSENKLALTRKNLGPGDIDRAIIEWRSRMRQILHSSNTMKNSSELAQAALTNDRIPQDNLFLIQRWEELKSLCKTMLEETESPALEELPPLSDDQTQRLDHKINLKKK